MPATTALLGLDGEAATIVALTRGLAHRTQEAFRFVCPERWGGDATAPTAGIPTGEALVAGDGLFLVDSDGNVSPHPSSLGSGVALASNRHASFGLFLRDGHYDVWQIARDSSVLVRLFVEPFGALAASEDTLWLLRWAANTLTLQQLTLTGELGEVVSWDAPSIVSYAELHVADDQLYVATWGSASPWVTLGRVVQHRYEPLTEAGSQIAGPVATAEGVLIARDGELGPLRDGESGASSGAFLTCLGSYQELPYACAHGDLMRVDANGLGAPLFELAALEEPDYRGLSETARSDCAARWRDLQEHIPPARGASADDAGTPFASAREPAANAPEKLPENGGCALGSESAPQAPWLSALFLLAFSGVSRCRMTRPRKRGCVSAPAGST